MGKDKSWFVVVIISKIDWNPGQGHGKILKNAGLLKTKNLFWVVYSPAFLKLTTGSRKVSGLLSVKYLEKIVDRRTGFPDSPSKK